MEKIDTDEKNAVDDSCFENSPQNTPDLTKKGEGKLCSEMKSLDVIDSSPDVRDKNEGERSDLKVHETKVLDDKEVKGPVFDGTETDTLELNSEMKSLNVTESSPNPQVENEGEQSDLKVLGTKVLDDKEEKDPVFDGTETDTPELGTAASQSRDSDRDQEVAAYDWPKKAVALKNFVKLKGAVAVSAVLRRLSSRKDENELPDKVGSNENEEEYSSTESYQQEASSKAGERSPWNPLNFMKIGPDSDFQNKSEQADDIYVENPVLEPAMKGRIVVYTRLGCPECKEVRSFMHQRRLKFVEINIDIFPTRKLELEKNTGSSAVPRVYFNDFAVGGIIEIKAMSESGKLDENINDLIDNEPPPAAPLPPLPGEDDMSGCGKIDELATIIAKMKEAIVLRDRFYKMRRFNNCFLGSEAVDFLAEDQYLERDEAVEFGRKLADKHFFRHVLDENIFEDGNHLYRFLEYDPTVSTQCYNIQRGINDVKPKPIIEIASRLRFLSFAIFEAYVSEDGRHVDYRSIQCCEEFQRYLRIIEELQRVELDDLTREEKLAFFINLYNMMAIHAILIWGYPVRALDRRKFLGDFKYVVGGCTYSLSAIQNGILRGNQRPPYNLMKPFGPKERRFKVSLSYPEPLVHFALVCGTRSGPALRCYSPSNIDKELMESARDFLRNGGLIVHPNAKVASLNKILRWYSVDFGKDEVEVLKHAANYMEPDKCEELLELLSNIQLKVTYQPYDWGLNC